MVRYTLEDKALSAINSLSKRFAIRDWGMDKTVCFHLGGGGGGGGEGGGGGGGGGLELGGGGWGGIRESSPF